MGDPHFVFVCCQAGAERPLKDELARNCPSLRFAYSRPGFVTFRLSSETHLDDDFELPSVFARCHGFSLGKVQGREGVAMADQAAGLIGSKTSRHLHVWQRDERLPGDHGFEPGVSVLAQEIGELLAERLSRSSDSPPPDVNRVVRSGTRVMDCVIVAPDEWWIGWHVASAPASRWPGGVCPMNEADPGVSRAYLKMTEALEWSRLPIKPGDVCVEIGSAPGGACLALLDLGLKVTGIDPADMDAEVLEHPNFTHIRKRGRDVRRREFAGVRWLVTDLNVAPKYTLDTVEEIVTHESVHIRGLLLTLKLTDWKLAEQIPDFLDRIRSWGFSYVRARQLAFNRREICVAALTSRSARRAPPAKRAPATRRRARRLDT